MEPLTPKESAAVAKAVYAVRRPNNRHIYEMMSGLNEAFSVDATSFVGVSGAAFFTSTDGFGYITAGTGRRKNEALIAIRGTETFQDVLTDINIAVETGPSGHLVHAGFHRTFKSFQRELYEHVSVLKPGGIHVIGHSLGGALATMVADYLQQQGMLVHLYTFGAPRLGMNHHSIHLTKSLPAENIYRVYNSADPVSMIPIFPFCQIPVTTNGYLIPSSGRIDPYSHKITSYIESIKENDWSGLSRLSAAPIWKRQAEAYLEELGSNGGVIMLSAASLWMILHALEAIVEGVGAIVGFTLVAGATVIDRLAQLLYTGYLSSITIADQLKRLMTAILKFAGRSAVTVTNISVAFISWVLNTLFSIVSNAALRALHLTERDFNTR